jgi:hypothetical protein
MNRKRCDDVVGSSRGLSTRVNINLAGQILEPTPPGTTYESLTLTYKP